MKTTIATTQPATQKITINATLNATEYDEMNNSEVAENDVQNVAAAANEDGNNAAGNNAVIAAAEEQIEIEEETVQQEHILEEFITPLNDQIRNTDWDEFEQLLEEIITKVQTECKIKIRAEGQLQEYRPTDPEDCKQIQRLYRNNRRKAVRLILDGESKRCNISNIQVAEHFQQIFQEKNFDREQLQSLPITPATRQEVTTEPFTEEEIKRRLDKAENTSPGADRITYKHWKKVDPDCTVLHLIYTICIKMKKIPNSWKKI